AVLRLPVRARGIRLGRPTDLIVDLDSRRAVGLDVLCGDRRRRFLPLAAARIESRTISVASALILLDELGAEFYRDRAEALRSLRGHDVERRGRLVGRLTDVVLAPDARLRALVVDTDEGELTVPLDED